MTNTQEAPANGPSPSGSTAPAENAAPADSTLHADPPTVASSAPITVDSGATPPRKRTFSRLVLVVVAAIALVVGLLAGGGAGFALGAWVTSSFQNGGGLQMGPDGRTGPPNMDSGPRGDGSVTPPGDTDTDTGTGSTDGSTN